MKLRGHDKLTWDILGELVRDARQSIRQISAALGTSAPPIRDRVRRLEDLGIIRGYRPELDLERLGWPVSAFVSLTAREGRCDSLMQLLREHPNVVAAYHVAGVTDYVARVVAYDLAELNSVTEALAKAGTVSTQIVLEIVFERTVIPVS